ncbi:MAG: hypothetical protein ACRD1C_13145 [Terriglobales bacterium]
MADYTFLLATRLSRDQQQVLRLLQNACRLIRLNLYYTGGGMRDLLTARPVRLLSFTTEGDPMSLQPALAAAGAERMSPQPDSATLSLSLCGCRLRVQAARGSRGTSGATIHEDLRRRSLALNSIGLSLNDGSRGLPLDPCNGAADIEARLIRMNHPYVFLDDPIAALRTVRLRTRLGFTIEERTAARIEAAREGNYLAHATPTARGQEWEAIAYEPDPAAVLTALEKEQWLAPTFGSAVRTRVMNLNALAKLTSTVEIWEQFGLTVDVGLLAMPLMLAGLPAADQNRIAQSLPSSHLATGWKKLVSEAAALGKRLPALASSGPGWLRSTHEALEKFSPEAVVYATLVPANAKAARKLHDFQTLALEQRQRLPLGVLRALGMAPHSRQSEQLLHPWFRRLLAGEALTDAALAEGVRAAALAVQGPAPAPAPGKKRKPAKPAPPKKPKSAAKSVPHAKKK